MNKKIVLLIALVVIISLFSACSKKDKVSDLDQLKENGKLRVLVSAENPPYEYKNENNEIVGVDKEIALRMAALYGVGCEFIEVNYSNLEKALLENKGDMIISSFNKQHAGDNVSVSDTYINGSLFIIAGASNESIESIESLDGKVVGVQENSRGDIYTTDHITAKKIIRSTSISDLYKMLKNGEIDAIVADSISTSVINSENDEIKRIYVNGTAEDYVIVVRKNSDLLPQINSMISSLNESGDLSEYIEKYTIADNSNTDNPEGN